MTSHDKKSAPASNATIVDFEFDTTLDNANGRQPGPGLATVENR